MTFFHVFHFQYSSLDWEAAPPYVGLPHQIIFLFNAARCPGYGPGRLSVFKLGCRAVRVILESIIINEMIAKGKIAFFKKFLPSDPLGPVTQPLILVGTTGICLNNFLGCCTNLLKPREFIGKPGNDYLGKLGGLIRFEILPRPGSSRRHLPYPQGVRPCTWYSSFRRTCSVRL